MFLPAPPLQRAPLGSPLASARPLRAREQTSGTPTTQAPTPAPLQRVTNAAPRPVVPLRTAPAAPLSLPAAALPRPVQPLMPTVQRRTTPTPAPAPAAPAPRAQPVQRSAQAPPPAAAHTPRASTEPDAPAELDALARRLVAPLSRLLRAELRSDRERVGRLRDR
ncbi:extensin [Streptomyces sp. NPDC050738]|uniref:extensin n=1 Tax=Streptomyces sp. NPDC050738 TaxID=3154744 RepID=UPI0034464D30